jgi:hypothetical protein
MNMLLFTETVIKTAKIFDCIYKLYISHKVFTLNHYLEYF